MIKTYLRNGWEKIQESYWAIPSLMMALAISVSGLTLWLDETVDVSTIRGFGWTYLEDPAGARTILSTIAGSMITVAGVVFSITIVVLTLASSQLGPRLVRSFMRDKGNQLVLGTFIATFIYCLLVLRRIHGVREEPFIPHLSVTCGVLLALVSLAVLIYFIHHIAASIQANNVILVVSAELDRTIDRLFPRNQEMVTYRSSSIFPEDFARQSAPLRSPRNGYIQAIDAERLVDIAAKHDVILVVERCPGDFVIAGAPLARCWPGTQRTQEIAEAVSAAILLGPKKSLEQDVSFAIQQLVEMAVRALSPGINDPFTAMACIDYLGAGLAKLLDREPPPLYRYDKESKLRLVLPSLSFADLADTAFDQIRQHGCSHAAVLDHLLVTLAMLALLADRDKDRQALLRHADLVVESSKHLREQRERDRIIDRHARLLNWIRAIGQ